MLASPVLADDERPVGISAASSSAMLLPIEHLVPGQISSDGPNRFANIRFEAHFAFGWYGALGGGARVEFPIVRAGLLPRARSYSRVTSPLKRSPGLTRSRFFGSLDGALAGAAAGAELELLDDVCAATGKPNNPNDTKTAISLVLMKGSFQTTWVVLESTCSVFRTRGRLHGMYRFSGASKAGPATAVGLADAPARRTREEEEPGRGPPDWHSRSE